MGFFLFRRQTLLQGPIRQPLLRFHFQVFASSRGFSVRVFPTGECKPKASERQAGIQRHLDPLSHQHTIPKSPSQARPPNLAGGGSDLQGELSLHLDPQDGDIVIVKEGHPNLDIDFEEPGYDSEEDGEPDTINGRTFPEMRSDGKISDRERAEAAMLMLGVAGGTLFNTFRSLLMLSTGP